MKNLYTYSFFSYLTNFQPFEPFQHGVQELVNKGHVPLGHRHVVIGYDIIIMALQQLAINKTLMTSSSPAAMIEKLKLRNLGLLECLSVNFQLKESY